MRLPAIVIVGPDWRPGVWYYTKRYIACSGMAMAVLLSFEFALHYPVAAVSTIVAFVATLGYDRLLDQTLVRRIRAMARHAGLLREGLPHHAPRASTAAPNGPWLTSTFDMTVLGDALAISFARRYLPGVMIAKRDSVMAIYHQLTALRGVLKQAIEENGVRVPYNHVSTMTDADGTYADVELVLRGTFSIRPNAELLVFGEEPLVLQLGRLLAISRDFALSHGPEPLSQYASTIAYLTDRVAIELASEASATSSRDRSDADPPPPRSGDFSSYARTIATHLVIFVTDEHEPYAASMERRDVYREHRERPPHR